MAPGARRKGGRGGGGGSKASGIEKYGKDAVEDFLNLSEDEEASEAESDVCEEEDVMALEGVDGPEDPEHWAPPKKAKGKPKVPSEDSDDEKERLAPATMGWKRSDFYGGDDAGDASGNDSEEDLVFKEAKRLEDLRAQQLTGGEDVLAALLAQPTDVPETAKANASAVKGLGGAPTSAQFEDVFSGEVEKVSVPKDLSALPLSERKGLIKKEAPELMPLLSDFKAKLASLQELLPMLRPVVLKKLPASGAAYLEAKAALLLNTLANLSFYLVLRAEGGAVRAHPVVPQLVWLRELHEQLSPLDEKLGKKVSSALTAARQALRSGVLADPSPNSNGAKQRMTSHQLVNGGSHDEAPKVVRKKTLRERMERLQSHALATAPEKVDMKKQSGAHQNATKLTKDLLKLPKGPAAAKGGASSGPTDLDDIDPTLGVWAPKSSIGEQLSVVQQQLREHAVRAKAAKASADQNTEARPRRARDRDRGDKHPEAPAEVAPTTEIAHDDDEDDDDLIKDARRAAVSKKERKTKAEAARAEQKEAARRLKEFKPEEVVEGRRATSKRILQNRGLARVRKKKAGNARVSNKEKYEKAIKRRKGAVQEMRYGDGDGATYDGEATGVRTHVRKSQKIS